jgi:DNA-binding NarL/FixJ family response regulator
MKRVTEDKTIRVAIVEDDEEIRRSLVLIVDGSPGYACVQAFANAEDALNTLSDDLPDVVLMDIGLPGMSGIEATQQLREWFPELDIVMLTVLEDDETVFNSLCAGANGYLMKSTPPAQLLQSIDEVHQGGSPMSASIARRVIRSFQSAPADASPLSRREREILEHLCDGESYRVIAEKLFVSGHTVRSHIKNIYSKLQVNSRAEAVRKAMRERLV